MSKDLKDIQYRGVNIIKEILSPLLGDIETLEAALSMDLQDIKAGPFTELIFGNKNSSFSVWITSIDRDTAAFAQTKRFKIGYRSKGDDQVAVNATRMVAKLVQKNEQSLQEQTYSVVFMNRLTPGSELVLFEDMAELRVTLKCNERCPFCNTIVDEHTRPDNVIDDRSMIKDLIVQAHNQGARTVVFTGGEPTLLRDLPEFIRFTHSQGMAAWIQTNGVIPHTHEYWQRFPELPDYVFVSFHTTKPERVKLLTGVGGTFSNKLETLKLLKKFGILFGINFVITRLNMDEIPLIPDFLGALLGVRGYDINYSFVAPSGRAAGNKDLIPRVGDVQELLAQAIDRCQQLGIDVRIPENCGFPRCVMPRYEAFFAASHRSRPIQAMDMDHVKFPRCRDCKYDTTCIGMWRTYVEIYGDGEFQPVKARAE